VKDGYKNIGARMSQVSVDGTACWGVVAASGKDVEIEKVAELIKIVGYKVFGIPTIVVDGEVKSVGNIQKGKKSKAGL